MFGNPETTTGGRALKFYSSVRVEVRRMAAIKDGETVIGNRTKIKVVKNKVAAPFREAEVDILYGEGISREGDLLDLGVVQELVEKSGSWFSFGGERIGQGRENARAFLLANPEIRDRLDSDLRTQAGLRIAPTPAPARNRPRVSLLEQDRPKRLNSGPGDASGRAKARFIGLARRDRSKKLRKTAFFSHSSLYIRLGIPYDLGGNNFVRLCFM